ncbi:12590_t:CDS:2 [Gigaspora rosea]|nr:12590_t:CDS:2 [Gigaspora rosea]
MAELREKLSQYIGFEPEKIRIPITEEDRQLFQELIANQEEMTDIVMNKSLMNKNISISKTSKAKLKLHRPISQLYLPRWLHLEFLNFGDREPDLEYLERLMSGLNFFCIPELVDDSALFISVLWNRVPHV